MVLKVPKKRNLCTKWYTLLHAVSDKARFIRREDEENNDISLRRSSTVSGTCFNHQVGQQVGDDISGWWHVVLEAHSREQINEESTATPPEFCIFLDRNPAESQKSNAT